MTGGYNVLKMPWKVNVMDSRIYYIYVKKQRHDPERWVLLSGRRVLLRLQILMVQMALTARGRVKREGGEQHLICGWQR